MREPKAIFVIPPSDYIEVMILIVRMFRFKFRGGSVIYFEYSFCQNILLWGGGTLP